MHYTEHFAKAMGSKLNEPFPYQTLLAGGDSGRPCSSNLIDIPTGLGKTAAVVIAWIWNRVVLQRQDWPRRLVYCLPMRTLVEQTQSEVQRWVTNVLVESSGSSKEAVIELEWLRDHSPIILMGGEEMDEQKKQWDVHPEKPAIIIGTQDMLLSRALNRGYGMSRYRWPMHFALLNNDCLWVMDETQLMGVGVETSAQMDGFRNAANMPVFGGCPTWWMSATLAPDRLNTVDHREPNGGWPTIRLSDQERREGRPHELANAPKLLEKAPVVLSKANNKTYGAELAKLIVERHTSGTLTLVVVNRVSRAQEVYNAITKGKKPLYDPAKVGLIHSRFRAGDRARNTALLTSQGDRIIIATQAVEAGVDVSARLLVTELAPWASLVQRFGRCNRRAEFEQAEVLWVDLEHAGEKDELVLPYAARELDKARTALTGLEHVAVEALSAVDIKEEPVVRPVIRRRDLVDLFDTTPDICGQDIDISRFIRDGNDTDVQFHWRDVPDDSPTVDEPAASRLELCRVSIGAAAKFLNKEKRIWRWNHLEKRWDKPERPVPGSIYLVDRKEGGYADELGWTGDAKDKPGIPETPHNAPREANDDEPNTFDRNWQTLTEHTLQVVEAARVINASLGVNGSLGSALEQAALWHDVGKAHPHFQSMLTAGDETRTNKLWAKADHNKRNKDRPGFRHELASALAWLAAAPPDVLERDLSAYLIAAHHGKVRLSIRSLPNEKAPPGPERLFARGVWHGDRLPQVVIGQLTVPETELDLSYMRMGEGERGASWLARTVGLRDRFGPFTLAYLEMLLRAADALASQESGA